MINKIFGYVRKEIEEFDSQSTQSWLDEEEIIKKLSKNFSNQDLYNASLLGFSVNESKIIGYDSDNGKYEVCDMVGCDSLEVIKEEFIIQAGEYLWNVFYDRVGNTRLEIYFDELNKETGLLDYIFASLQSEVEYYLKTQSYTGGEQKYER